MIDSPESLVVGVPELLKLHLACGQRKREGYVNVDISESAKPDVVQDLLEFPWQWPDDSVSEIVCEHFMEHIHACNYGEIVRFDANGNICGNRSEYNGKDYLILFMNECYRVLKPGGTMKVVVPAASSDRAFQDPTHRRFIPRQFFAYLEAPWRKEQKLDHMDFVCDFETNVSPMIDINWAQRNDDARWFAMEHYRNVTMDLSVALKAVKPIRTGV